jgi:phosphotriesterase-related protein
MSTVPTVRGPVAPEELGVTLAHEHVISVLPEVQRDFPDLAWEIGRDAVIAYVAEQLRALAAQGVGTIVDCTAIDHGRDVPALVEANRDADIHLVVATGIYRHDDLPFFYRFRADPGRDILQEMFVRDLRDGVQGPGVRAGVIKCTTDLPGVTPHIDRILRSAARAHRETGAPITTHSRADLRNGLDQQEVFRQEGVDLTRVVIGHSGDTTDLDYLERLLDAGSYIGADRFGLYGGANLDLAERVDVVARLCERGWASQILLAHDAAVFADWWRRFTLPTRDVAPTWTLFHMLDEVVPAMRDRGIAEDDIHRMLVDNPRTWLARNEAY